jgi:hypothetical protein
MMPVDFNGRADHHTAQLIRFAAEWMPADFHTKETRKRRNLSCTRRRNWELELELGMA